MLLHHDEAAAYHRFDSGLTELVEGLAWSQLEGETSFTGGRIGRALSAGVSGSKVGHPAAPYGTLHGAERIAVSFWIQNLFTDGGEAFIGFLDGGGSLSNGMRFVAESADNGVSFPVWIELANSGSFHRFPVALQDLDVRRASGDPWMHFIVSEIERDDTVWRLRHSADGGDFRDGGEIVAPRLSGPPIDLPEQVPDDETSVGLAIAGSDAAIDEIVLWVAAPPIRRVHAERMFSLWSNFQEPLDAYSDRFGGERHPDLPRGRGDLGTPCLVEPVCPPSTTSPPATTVTTCPEI